MEKLGECCLLKFLLTPAFLLKVVVICYVDDLFYWAMHKIDVFDLVIQLQGEEVDLKQEDDAKDLIKHVLEILGLDIGTANVKYSPAKGKPLVKHMNVKPASGDFNSSNVVICSCILLDTLILITYSVNCTTGTRYIFFPNLLNEHALK
ncbi:LOW QUALITY PROTEIN: hypothetical protein ACHAXS_013225 [Conticribra weissflogii]